MSKCCNTCPFLKCNEGKPTPNKFKIDKNIYAREWYTQATLEQLLKDLRGGTPMICHSTDSNAETYGGFNAVKGKEKLCVGALLFHFMHIKVFEKLLDYGKYVDKVGFDNAIDEDVLLELAWMFILKRPSLYPVRKSLNIPDAIDEDRELRFSPKFKKLLKFATK